MKGKLYKVDLIKFKNFCCVKNSIKKTKRQPTVWEKTFANHIFDKDLYLECIKKLLQFNSKIMNNPIRKWAKDLKRHFTEENIQLTNKQMKTR